MDRSKEVKPLRGLAFALAVIALPAAIYFPLRGDGKYFPEQRIIQQRQDNPQQKREIKDDDTNLSDSNYDSLKMRGSPCSISKRYLC